MDQGLQQSEDFFFGVAHLSERAQPQHEEFLLRFFLNAFMAIHITAPSIMTPTMVYCIIILVSILLRVTLVWLRLF